MSEDAGSIPAPSAIKKRKEESLTKRQSPTLRAALEYAEDGFAVFPCGPDKTPRIARGFHDATTDADAIRDWFTTDAKLTIGLAVPEGFIIIDTDPRNGGTETMRALRREHGRGAFPRTLTAKTGGGGEHRWYRVPEEDQGERLRGKLGVGVDVKRAGKGYVIVPPSLTDSGPYQWLNDNDAVDAPAWMMDALRRHPSELSGAVPARDDAPAIFPFADGTAYGEAALRHELDDLALAQPGGRNDALNAAAYSLAQLIAGGELKEDVVRARLEDVARDLDLTEHETQLTIDSAFAAGFLEPRNAPERPDAEQTTEGTSARLDEESDDEEHGFWLDWSGDAPADEYILQPVLPRQAYVLVYGPTEASKSMVFNALGAEASCRGFTVSVYSLENPPNVDRRRLQRLSPCGDRFRLSNQLLNLADERQARALLERERGRDLVILDTYSHAFAQRYDSGDGNAKAIEFARVIRWLIKHTGATFVVLDHTGFERMEEPRDASAKRQQVDVAIGMRKRGAWVAGEPARFEMHNYKSARFANPFTIRGEIRGNADEPLTLNFEGDEMTWGS